MSPVTSTTSSLPISAVLSGAVVHQITIGSEFFRKERDNAYTEWASAFWREMFQNSGDAGATHIYITLRELEENVFRVVFTDNGCGMTKDVTDNVFFRLGASTKDQGGDQVGGFGRARILTHFAQEQYWIESGDLHIHGSGANYSYIDPVERVRGTRMTIDVRAMGRWGKIRLRKELTTFLEACQPRYKVFVDGIEHTKWAYRRKTVRELSFGTVHVNKSHFDTDDVYNGKLPVRVKGTLMYSVDITPKVLVILEIDPAKSRDTLQSSRDSLQRGPREELDAFVSELNTETRSALTGNKTPDRTVVRGIGTFKAYNKSRPLTFVGGGKVSTATLAALAEVTVAKGSSYTERAVERSEAGGDCAVPAGEMLGASDNVLTPADRVADRFPDGIPPAMDNTGAVQADPLSNEKLRRQALKPGQVGLDAATRKALFSVYMYSNFSLLEPNEVSAYRRAFRRFNPENWEWKGESFKGLSRLKLMLVWKIACEFAVDALMEATDLESVNWGVGWYFSKGCRGGHLKEDGDVHFLSLNPVDNLGRDRYSLTDETDLAEILAIACHEATHIVFERHDEEFAGMMTFVLARAMTRYSAFKRALAKVRQVRTL